MSMSPSAATTATPPNIVTTGPLCDRFGLARSAVSKFIDEGMPAFKLDATRWVFPLDECEAWLREHGHLDDPYRAAVKRLVVAAPEVTAEQFARIRAILSEGGSAA